MLVQHAFAPLTSNSVGYAFNTTLRIGGFKAHDYFGDGSFYLLSTPGHAISHMSGFARLTSNPDTFVFMGADLAHHNGEFRPSIYHALPRLLYPNPLNRSSPQTLPSYVFQHLLRENSTVKAVYNIATLGATNGVQHDLKDAERTIERLMVFDAYEDIFVLMAHDDSVKGVVDFFPGYANSWKSLGWGERSRWMFLKDFEGASMASI